MMEVIIPVDFSPTSAAALRFGANLAELLCFNLRVVHVYDLATSPQHGFTSAQQEDDEVALGKQLKAFAKQHVADIQKENAGRVAVKPKVSHQVLSGMTVEKLLDLSRDVTTAFLVMGGVGTGAGLHLPGVYGSVATSVATNSGCPVILIPREYTDVAVTELAIAFDDAKEISRIAPFARSVVRAVRPTVHYVHISKKDWQSERENEEDFLDLSWGKGFPSYTYKFDILPPGDVVDSLRAYTKDNGIDLLILGRTRRSFWRRFFEKKHLKSIIRAVDVPMLIVPFSDEN